MRIVLSLCLLASACGAAAAQSLEGSLTSTLNSGLAAGLNSGLASGFASSIGTEIGDKRANNGRIGAVTVLGTCAPGQFDLNHTGCRSLREPGLDVAGSSYDLSIQGMGPLQGMTLDGLTLDFSNGPAGPD